MLATLLKVTLVPVVVLLASLAGRRFGHTTSGWIAGLPLIAAPLVVILALDQGPAFAAEAARASLAATAASSLHCLAFAHASRRLGWMGSLAAGWTVFFALGSVLAALAPPIWLALPIAAAALAVTVRLMPATEPVRAPVRIPSSELAVRVAAAFVLALAIVIGAPLFGTALSGLLLTFPINGSIIPAFTRALHGPAATVQMLAGFARGLVGFALFVFGVALAFPIAGTWAGLAFALGLSLAGYFAIAARAAK